MSDSSFSRSSDSEQAVAPPESPRWLIWPWVVAAVALALVLVGRGGLLTTTRGDMGGGHSAVGKPIVQFDLEPLTGDLQPLTAADLQGKVTLVNFWGPWCPPCKIEFPQLMDVARHHAQKKDFQFVSVSCLGPDEEDGLAERTAAFLKEFKANISTWHDPTEETRVSLVQDVGITKFGYPTSLVIDRGGKVRGVWVGYSAGDETAISELISQLLREQQ